MNHYPDRYSELAARLREVEAERDRLREEMIDMLELFESGNAELPCAVDEAFGLCMEDSHVTAKFSCPFDNARLRRAEWVALEHGREA